jgi:hypothetical protein
MFSVAGMRPIDEQVHELVPRVLGNRLAHEFDRGLRAFEQLTEAVAVEEQHAGQRPLGVAKPRNLADGREHVVADAGNEMAEVQQLVVRSSHGSSASWGFWTGQCRSGPGRAPCQKT